MTALDTPQPIPEEHLILGRMYHEAQQLEEPERTEQIAVVSELAGDVSLAELVAVCELDVELHEADAAQQLAADYISRARELAQNAHSAERDDEPLTQVIDFNKIGWIDRDGLEAVPAKIVKTSTLTYKFIDLISMSPTATEQFEKLETQSVAGNSKLGTKLMQEVEEVVIPKLDDGIRHGRNVRVVSSGGNTKAKAAKSLNTTYTGYKEGVHGPKNRAIILRVDERGSDMPSYAVVALYDHDDDKAIHRSLFLSSK